MRLVVRRGAVDPMFLLYLIENKRDIADIASDESRPKLEMEIATAERLLVEFEVRE